MTLTEFLATANVDDTLALAEAKAHEESRLWRIEGAVRKTQVETAVIVNDTVARLQNNIETSSSATVVALSKAVKRALDQLYNPEFYINLNDPTVKTMFDNALAMNVLLQAEADEIAAAATHVSKPFANLTIEQLKAARYPATTRDVTIASGNNQVVLQDGSLLGQSNSGGFRFTVTPTDTFSGSISVTLKAKKQDETIFASFPQLPIVIQGDFVAGEPVSYTFKRTQSLLSYRHFTFTFEEPYANSVASVTVESV